MSCSFSIIVTNYNHLGFLPKMIEMLEAQTFQDFEIIIIDNNSSDNSRNWIKKQQHLFSHVILNRTNFGLCKAFNQGVKLSQGKYLIDLAPDDLFTPNKLEQNYKLLEAENAHLLFSDCIIKEVHGKEYLHSEKYNFNYHGKGNYFTDILERHCLISPTTVMSRHCYDNVGGYDESLAYEDFDFMTKASNQFDLVYDHEALVIKQEVKNSLSTDFRKRNSAMHLSTFTICKRLSHTSCHTQQEKKVLRARLNSEMKAQVKLLNLVLVLKYLRLISEST